MHHPGLCAVCRREPRGFGWFDARYRISDARRDTSRRRLCSRLCQDLCHRRRGMIDPLDDLFHGCALRAYLETYAETRQFPPDSETVRQRAYAIYEEELAAKNASKSPI